VSFLSAFFIAFLSFFIFFFFSSFLPMLFVPCHLRYGRIYHPFTHGDLQAAAVPQGGRFGTPVVPAIRFDASTVMAETSTTLLVPRTGRLAGKR
jgi:hypothetical protein